MVASDSNAPEGAVLQVELLEQSFEKIRPQTNEFADSFYKNLFTDYPAAKSLFANTDMATQSHKLLMSLVFVVENLRNSDALTETLKGLGTRHVQYGALPEHYPLVGNSLLKTFEQYLGDDWTDEVKQAWLDAYWVITKIMLQGADYSSESVQLNTATTTQLESPESNIKPGTALGLIGGGVIVLILLVILI